MKHTSTVSQITPQVSQELGKQRCRINSKASRLRDLSALFMQQFKGMQISLMVHQNETRFQETYKAHIGEFAVTLTILAYHEKDIVPSLVQKQESIRQIHGLRSHLACFSKTASFTTHDKLYDFPVKAFVVGGEKIDFQCDADEGVWSIYYSDLANRYSACVEILHSTLMEPAPVTAKR